MKLHSDLSPELEAFCEFLGVTVLFVNVVLKMPQILTIWHSGGTTCISLRSTVLEWISYTVMLVYPFALDYPVHTYIECVFAVLQDYILVLMIMHYRNELSPQWILPFMVYNVAVVVTGSGILPEVALYAIMLATTPMLIWSKIDQIKEMYVNKDAGQVSLATWGLTVYDTGVRQFTTALITHDTPLQINLSTSQVFNVAIVACILYYRCTPGGLQGPTPPSVPPAPARPTSSTRRRCTAHN